MLHFKFQNVRNFILFTAIFLIPYLGGYANEYKGFQLWNNVTLNHSLNEIVLFSAELTSRFKERPFHVYYYEAELDFITELPCNWEFTVGHQIQYEKNDEDKWLNQPAPLIWIKKEWKYHSVTCSNRSRVEYCFYGNQWTYRNRTRFDIDLKGCSLIAYQEFFFTEDIGYNENRLFFGVKKSISDSTFFAFGYLYLLEKSTRQWDSYNALNWNFSLAF